MIIDIQPTGGVVPKVSPVNLADTLAARSVDARDDVPTLTPWNGPRQVATVSDTGSLHKYKEHGWLSAPGEVEYALVPLGNDPFDYLALTDDQYPKLLRNDQIADPVSLGMPQPDVPAITQPIYSVDDTDLRYDTAYKVTWVDAWGREGPASAPSEVVTICESDDGVRRETVTVQRPALPVGNWNLVAGSLWRVYRLNEGIWQFVAEVDYLIQSYVDTVPQGSLAEALISDDWVGPPRGDVAADRNGTLRGIVAVNGGYLAGHTRHDICLSVPGTVHAFPYDYRYAVPEEVIGLVPVGPDVVILTDERPYLLIGSHPSAMQLQRLATAAPATHRRAAVELNGAVYFASPLGLYQISGGQLSQVSEPYWTQNQWAALDPSTLRLSRYEERLVICSPAAGKTWLLSTANPGNGLREVSMQPAVSHVIPETGELAYLDGADVQVFNGDGAPGSLSWESKHFRLGYPYWMACARVESDSYPVTVTFHCQPQSGAPRSFTKTVTDDRFFYLSGDLGRAAQWWVSLDDQTCDVRRIRLAEYPEDLGNV